MGKFTKIDNYEEALEKWIASYDNNKELLSKKFKTPLTEEILIKNKWEQATCTSFCDGPQDGWVPPYLGQRYDDTIGDWVEIDDDFEDVFIWDRVSKDAWCYKYAFGTYIYQIKSIAELEMILAREGFVYHFDI